MAVANPAVFPGLELLATAVAVLDGEYVVRYTNPAAENLLGAGAKTLIGQQFPELFTDSATPEAWTTQEFTGFKFGVNGAAPLGPGGEYGIGGEFAMVWKPNMKELKKAYWKK